MTTQVYFDEVVFSTKPYVYFKLGTDFTRYRNSQYQHIFLGFDYPYSVHYNVGRYHMDKESIITEIQKEKTVKWSDLSTMLHVLDRYHLNLLKFLVAKDKSMWLEKKLRIVAVLRFAVNDEQIEMVKTIMLKNFERKVEVQRLSQFQDFLNPIFH
ncbi:hypothetical protein DAMA08_043670 [Martiniozyma asiatica (nom. inval.)]|nr:hypothetical protein DAMA08_043670 [Martiniozyma asiatica]